MYFCAKLDTVMKKTMIFLAAVLISTLSYGQQKRLAVVELSSVYMRISPDYESALETQELMGTVVEIVGEKGYWREIISPQPYKAWCTEKGITEISEADFKNYNAAPKCIFNELYGHVYESPSWKSPTICDLVGGDMMRYAGWSASDRFKPVRKGTWTQIMLPSGKTGWVQSSALKIHDGFTTIAKGEGNAESISDELMEKIIAEAFRLKGVPYLWGGMTPKGVDCSGLVRWSHLMNGILLPRNASQMIFCGDEIALTGEYGSYGTENLHRGDLVFFGTPATSEKPQRVTHVGIYIGDGRIIHSSHMVRVNSLNPAEPDYYENAHRLIAARRL